MIDFKSKFGRLALKQIQSEYFVWLTTVDSNGAPQPRPVWFIWEKDSFLVFSQKKAHKVKHIRKNPQVSLHFNTADKKGEKRLIVFTGTARLEKNAAPAHKIRAYMKKYKTGIAGLGATPEQFSSEYSVAIRIAPVKLRGWE
ncbi:MAG: TIGR03667 family PPOX class F420-dependent oxidoreductase [Anaerolineales bacterium]|nr:TIGR03667 family PPOX class F420-dependent oxidoreductase [Anaerolineales bacterium]